MIEMSRISSNQNLNVLLLFEEEFYLFEMSRISSYHKVRVTESLLYKYYVGIHSLLMYSDSP